MVKFQPLTCFLVLCFKGQQTRHLVSTRTAALESSVHCASWRGQTLLRLLADACFQACVLALNISADQKKHKDNLQRRRLTLDAKLDEKAAETNSQTGSAKTKS